MVGYNQSQMAHVDTTLTPEFAIRTAHWYVNCIYATNDKTIILDLLIKFSEHAKKYIPTTGHHITDLYTKMSPWVARDYPDLDFVH